MNVHRRIVVHGRVHGVGYRWSCKREADRLGVDGWVQNRPDGTVELVAGGNETAVRQLVEWCRRGPRGAIVTDVEVFAEDAPGGGGGFDIVG